MKTKIIGIAAGLICCAFFIVAIVLLKRPESELNTQDEEESSTQSSQQGFSHDNGMITSRDDIRQVTVTAGGKSFTAVISDNGIPQIKELEGIKQNTQLANALVTMCRKIQPYKLVESDVSDMKKYGLDEPKGIGEIVYKDSSKVRVLVGDKSPNSDNSHVYAAVEGQKKVWLVESSVQLYFTGKAEDYVSTSMSPVSAKTSSVAAKMTIFPKDAQDIVLERNNDKWQMTAPVKAELDTQKASGIVNGLYGLSAQFCECIKPDDTKKAEFGLKEPAVKVSFKEGTADLVLYIGNAVKRSDESEKQYYYCDLKGSADTDCIYAVDKENQPWIDATAQGLVSEVMIPNYLVNLKRIDIEVDGKKTEYTITNEGGDSSRINEDISKMRTASVVSSGKELELMEFRKFYELLMKCPTNKIFTKDVNANTVITVVYHKNDGTADRLELVKTSEGLGARVNGKMSYLVPQSWADAVIADINALAEGKELRTEF